MRLLALSLLTLSLAACGKPAEKAAEPPPPAATTPTPAPVAKAPEPPAQSLVAVSTTAMGVTGDLELTTTGLTFDKGLTYVTKAAPKTTGAATYGKDGDSWADLMGVDADTSIEVRAVSAETVAANAPNGGLCGKDKTTFIALSVGKVVAGSPMLTVAAFQGANAPGPGGAATDLCGTYGYQPK